MVLSQMLKHLLPFVFLLKMNTTQLLDCCDRRHDRPSQIFARWVKLKLLSPCFTFSTSENRTFYNYDGSLTTPPLLESVIWTVFKEHITMSEEQVDSTFLS